MPKTQVSLTQGSVAKGMLTFAVPIFLSNLFQQLYNAVDSLIVGNFLGEHALAAVGSSGSLIFLLTGFVNGVSLGAGVLVARYFGAKDDEALRKAVHTTVALGLAAGAALTVIGVALSPQILRWMGTPDDVIGNSIVYFRVYFMGCIAVVLYNVGASILQSVGDSRSPMLYLIAASVLNVVLDLLFVAGFHMGVGSAAFATILSQHGETLHNHRHDGIITPGKLLLVDAGAESNTHYASDFTRTVPCGGKFSPVQRDIYDIVVACNDLAYDMAAPGVSYRDVHLAVAARMLEGLKALDLVRGDVQDMVTEGIAGMFMPHGLGHNMGIDVHDMEDLGEDLVGYDQGQRRSSQLGLGSLRMARVLKPGHVVTDEPGIYFIPALIAKWKAEGTGKDFINYGKLEKGYLDFGGIRLEDDLLITPDGCRRLGSRRLPIYPDEVEAAMAAE